MAVSSIKPQSGVQLIIILGAAFLLAGVHPTIGMNMLILGIAVWLIYNFFNFRRQF